MVDAAATKKPLIYRMFAGSWSPTEFGLKKMAVASLVLASVRWALQRKIPELLHAEAPSTPAWARLYYAAQLLFVLAATLAAGAHIVDAIRTRDWKALNLVGLLLYVIWWIEVGFANGHFGGFIR